MKLVLLADFINFTSDTWTAKYSAASFISFTAHFMDRETGNFKCYVLRVKYFPDHHTASNISKVLLEMLSDYNIPPEKVHAIVTDNAHNITKGVKDAGFINLGCFLHTLQLVVNNAVLAQPGVQNVIKKCRAIVAHFHKSTVATEELRKMAISKLEAGRKLILDVVTRWNSTFMMLQSCIKNKKAIKCYLVEHEKESLSLSESEWCKIEAKMFCKYFMILQST